MVTIKSSFRSFQALIEVIHEEIVRRLLLRIRLVRPIRAALNKRITVRWMVKTRPGRIFPGLDHPFVCKFEYALQMLMIAANVQNRRIDAADAFHRPCLVGVFAHDFDVLILDLGALARRAHSFEESNHHG